MSAKALYAQFFLAAHLARRLGRRLLFRRSPALKDFLEFYREDKIVPFKREEKLLLSLFARCIGCGLCDALSPSISRHPLGASFLPRLSRSLPDFAGATDLDPSRYESSEEGETLCPMGVPLRKIVDFLQERENETSGSPFT